MIAANPKPKRLPTLRQFYVNVYAPEHQHDCSARAKDPWITAINRFALLLGREARLTDLTTKRYAEFEQATLALHKEKSALNTLCNVRSLWREAVHKGLIDDSELPRPRKQNPTPPPPPHRPLLRGHDNPKSLLNLFRTEYVPLRLLGRSPRSVVQHEVILSHFGQFLGRAATVDDLDDMTVSRFLGYLLDVRKQCAIGANKSMDKLLAQWRFLCRRRHVERWPEIRKLPQPEIIPQAWMAEQVERLLASCGEERGTLCGVKASDWWTGIHLVIWDTGERIGAVMALRCDDLDFEGRWLHIRAETRKGKKRGRMQRLGEDTVAHLRKMIEPRRELLFPFPSTKETVYNHYERILQRAGLPSGRRDKFHRMRRTVASYFKAAGGDATELLDHTSRTVTQAYLDPAHRQGNAGIGPVAADR